MEKSGKIGDLWINISIHIKLSKNGFSPEVKDPSTQGQTDIYKAWKNTTNRDVPVVHLSEQIHS